MFLKKNKIYFARFIYITFLFITTMFFAKVTHSSDLGKMEERSKKTRFSVKEPDYFVSGNSSRWVGLYFGVGFRQIRLNVIDEIIIFDSDAEANGIGVNLGYFWDNQGLEFERQTSIINLKESLTYDNQESEIIEVIQNNFWYIRYPKVNRFLYLQYGAGIQFTKTRLAGPEIKRNNTDEVALGIQTGVSYYITQNMLLLYRFSLGQQISLINNQSEKKFLNQSQIHSIYINYYISL